MRRGQLPKAYLRVDPNLDQTHPDNLDGFMRLLFAANRQSQRGRFRSREVLDTLLGKRAVDRLYVRGDVADQDDGSVLVPGWDQWQEGDLTVGERMSRLRSRTVTPPSQPRNTGVTPPSPDRSTPSEASRRLGVKASTSESKTPINRERARSNGSRVDEPRLTKAQLEAWATFTESCWSPFKNAWLVERHLLFPPFGHPDDDPGTSQRSRLYRIADARPLWLADRVRQAPGKTAHDIIGFIFEGWAALELDVGAEEEEVVEAQRELRRDRTPMKRLGEILPSVLPS